MKTPITGIMSSQVTTVTTGTPLEEVRRIVEEGGFGHLPVVSKGRVVGMLSRSDLERVSFMGDPGSESAVTALSGILTAGNLMSRSPLTLQTDQTVRDAAVIFSGGKIHALPVLEGSKLVGIVTTTDLIKMMLGKEG